MVIFYGFDPLFGPNGTHWPQDGHTWGSPPWFGAITVKSNFGRNRWRRGSRKFEFLGMDIFYGFDPFFFTQWDPIGPKMDPRGSPPWFVAITVKSNLGQNRWARGSRKFEFWGMVIFYVFDPFFYQMGPHWPQDGPWGSPPWFGAIPSSQILAEIDERGVVENSNYGAW